MDTTELLAEIRRNRLGPQTPLLATDDTDLLAHADRVIEEELAPRLIDIFEDYLLQEVEETLSSSKVRIPSRAYNTQVRTIFWKTASGTGQNLRDILPAKINDKAVYGSSGGTPEVAYFEGDHIVIVGTPSGFLEISFPFRPGKLVTSDNFRKITNVNTSSGLITLDSAVPTGWNTSSNFDIHSHQSSGQIANWDLTASVVSGTSITFTATDIDGSVFGRRAAAVDNYVVLKDKAAVPMIPQGLHGTLALGTALRISMTQTDAESYQLLSQHYRNSFNEQIRSLDNRLAKKQPLINWNSRFRRFGGGRYRRLFT
jgi:hypothetical protein